MVLCQNNRSQVRDISCNLINPIGEALYSFWGRRKAHLEVSQQINIFSRIKNNELEQHADELETFGNKHFSKENTFFFFFFKATVCFQNGTENYFEHVGFIAVAKLLFMQL